MSIYVHISVNVHVSVCMYVGMCMCVCMCTCVCIHLYVHAICTCYLFIHVCVGIHTHMYPMSGNLKIWMMKNSPVSEFSDQLQMEEPLKWMSCDLLRSDWKSRSKNQKRRNKKNSFHSFLFPFFFFSNGFFFLFYFSSLFPLVFNLFLIVFLIFLLHLSSSFFQLSIIYLYFIHKNCQMSKNWRKVFTRSWWLKKSPWNVLTTKNKTKKTRAGQ